MKSETLFGIVLYLVIILSFHSPTSSEYKVFNSASMDVVYPGYESHTPFYIYGNEMFLDFAAAKGWEGTGSNESPIIIKGYYFQNYSHVFTVSDTDLHFTFRDNILDGIDETWCVIVFSNVTNAKVQGNTIINGAVGAHIMKTNDTVFSDNHIYGQSWDAIYMETDCYRNIIENNYFHDMYEAGVWSWNGCSDNIVRGNTIHDVLYGVSFRDNSPSNTIFNNTICNATFSGIYTSCNDTTISNNTISQINGDGVNIKSMHNVIEYNLIHDAGGYGIHLFDDSGNTQIRGNILIYNEDGGLKVRESDNNMIQMNDFFENGKPQTFDAGNQNLFSHNYWHEWQGEDGDSDGFFDSAYSIPGIGNSSDIFSKTTPNGALPDWYVYGPPTTPTTTTSSLLTTTFSTTTFVTSTSSTSQTTTTTESTQTSTPSIPSSPDVMAPILLTGITLSIAAGVLVSIKLRRGH